MLGAPINDFINKEGKGIKVDSPTWVLWLQNIIKIINSFRFGSGTLVGGTITIANKTITANTQVFLSVSTLSGTQGMLHVTRIAGTSFTITSSSNIDTSTISYILIEPF